MFRVSGRRMSGRGRNRSPTGPRQLIHVADPDEDFVQVIAPFLRGEWVQEKRLGVFRRRRPARADQPLVSTVRRETDRSRASFSGVTARMPMRRWTAPSFALRVRRWLRSGRKAGDIHTQRAAGAGSRTMSAGKPCDQTAANHRAGTPCIRRGLTSPRTDIHATLM